MRSDDQWDADLAGNGGCDRGYSMYKMGGKVGESHRSWRVRTHLSGD